MVVIIKGCEHDDRYEHGVGMAAQLPYYVIAAHIGQRHVAYQQRRLPLTYLVIAVLASGIGIHMEIHPHLRLYLLQHVGVILYHGYVQVIERLWQRLVYYRRLIVFRHGRDSRALTHVVLGRVSAVVKRQGECKACAAQGV